MKQLGAILFFLAISLEFSAQKISGATTSNEVQNSARSLPSLPKGLIFYEGFDNVQVPNLPANWTTFSAGNQAYMTGTAGNEFGQTNANGFWPVPNHGFFAFTNDDVCNCDKSIDLLSSKKFDFSEEDFLRIGFSAFQNGSGGQKAELQVKNSAAVWQTLFEIPSSSDWEDYSFVIPSTYYAPNFQFRFKYNDQGNYASGLAVDDIYISNKSSGQFALKEFYAIDGNLSASGHLGYSIPKGQARHAHLKFGGETKNSSLQSLNGRLKVEISGPISFLDTTSTYFFAPGDDVVIRFHEYETFTPYDSGAYSLSATLLTDSTDSNAQDNYFSSSFIVTDSVYSRTNGTSDGTGIWMVNEASRMGSVFQIYKTDTIKSMWISIHPTTTEGARFKIKIFDFNTLTSSIYSSAPIAITSSDLGKEIRVELDKVLSPGKYLFILESETNSSNRLVISSSSKNKSPKGISFYQNPGQPWTHLAYYPNFKLVFPIINSNCPGHIQASMKYESCPNAQDGRIDVEAKDVNFIPTYSWSNGAGNINHIENLASGSYQVVVTDANNCIYSRTFDLQPIDTLDINPTIELDSCGAGKASITLNTYGGQAPYKSYYNSNLILGSIRNLTQGSYPISIVDDNGCDLDTTVKVNGTDALNIAVGIQSSSCGSTNGKLSANALGTPPFQYIWNTGDSLNQIDGLSSGIYKLTVSDSINCAVAVTVFLNDSNSPVLSLVSKTDIACFGESSGSIKVGASGNNAPFHFAWSNSDTLNELLNVPAGVYEVSVSDSLGCTSYGSFSIENIGQPFSIDLIENGISCYGAQSGELRCLVNGGKKPYNYLWSPNGSVGNSISNLGVGDYSIIVTDNKGCTKAASTALQTQPEFFYTVDSIFGDTNGVATLDAGIFLSVYGGTPPYSYDWSNGFKGQDLKNVDTGFYSVVITDQFGCSIYFEKFLSNNPLGTQQSEVKQNISVALFPNPASITDLIHLKSNKEIESVMIHDILGKPVNSYLQYSKTEAEFEISTTGIYFVSVFLKGGEQETLRLITF